MKRFLIETGWILGCVLLGVFTISFWMTLEVSWAFQPLVFLPFLLVVCYAPDRALLSGAIFGIMLDLFSALPFGVFTISLLGSIAVVIVSQQKFFKAHAVHTVILHTVFATAMYHIFFGAFVRGFELLGFIPTASLPSISHGVFVTGVHTALYGTGMLIVYGSSVIFQKRFIQTAAL